MLRNELLLDIRCLAGFGASFRVDEYVFIIMSCGVAVLCGSVDHSKALSDFTIVSVA